MSAPDSHRYSLTLKKSSRYLILLTLSIFSGLLFGHLGSSTTNTSWALFSRGCIALIFFNIGISLNRRVLLNGFRPFKLQVYCLAWTYVLFPVVILGFLGLAEIITPVRADWVIAFFLLSILPTTVSSASALSFSAGGNTSAAVYACLISNICGIFLVPLLGHLWLFHQLQLTLPATDFMLLFCILLLAPLTTGQLATKWIPHLKQVGKSRYPQRANDFLILLLVFFAFADTQAGAFFRDIPLSNLALVITAVLFLALLIHFLVWVVSRLIFPGDRENQITVLFCGSQKSLATGLPMISLILESTPYSIALCSIPLLIYHPIQLGIGCLIAHSPNIAPKPSKSVIRK